jgi:NADPH-dependent 2,4-dienoyl-CoA reductase/sulfur reductase-like enzyme
VPVEEELRRHVDLRLGTAVVGVESAADGAHVTTGDGELDVDLVVCAVGIRPATAMLVPYADTTAGGALLVDDRMRTSVPGVLAAGDSVALPHLVTGRPAYVPLGPAANRTGRVAGIVAAGGDARFPGVVGTAVVKVFGLTVARTGLGEEEARDAGFDPRVTDVVHRSRAKYFPGSEPVRVRLVADADGRLLGGQMVSADPATAKRIDVLATALHAGMHLDDVAGLDLSYAPPYAPVYDPVVQAAVTAAGRRVPAPTA